MTTDNNDQKTVWAFQHVGHEDLGTFEATFEALGWDIKYICGRHTDLKKLNPLEPDLLVVLGGPMGVYETDEYPYLLSEIELVRQRIAAKKPTLGICLGAQIIAKALGAKVYKGHSGVEIGWHSITVNETGHQTPLKYLDKTLTNMMHWHGDTFELPKGATRLATSEKYKNQAYSYQNHVLAIQCHPEITPHKLGIWYEVGAADIAQVEGLSVDILEAEAKKYGKALKAQSRLFLIDWLKEQNLFTVD